MTNQYQVMVVSKTALADALCVAKDIGEYERLQAVHLRHALGMTMDAIAEATGFSVSHIKRIYSDIRYTGRESW